MTSLGGDGGSVTPNWAPPNPQGTYPPRQHAPGNFSFSSPPPPRQRKGYGRPSVSPVWVVLAAVIAAWLIHAHRINSTEIILFCVLMPSIIFHEVSHGAVAYLFGDDTAKRAGRLSLNPLRHVDPIGTIVVPAITVLSGYGFFGWAKPVPVDVRRLRHPRNQSVFVSLAGPFTNVVLAAICGLAFHVFYIASATTSQTLSLPARVLLFAGAVNLWVAIFNMVPIPPLDGSALIERVLPRRLWPAYMRLRSRGMFLVFALILLLALINVNPLAPVFNHVINWYATLISK